MALAEPDRDDEADRAVAWRAQPGPQWHFIRCPVFEVFFGGARGGGKTDAVLGEWAAHAGRYGKDAIGLMVRRSLVELTETIERSRQIYLPLGATLNEQSKMWRFPNGARLRFAYLDRDSDAEAYQGSSFTRVYVEEIGNFPSPAPILKLMATLRSGAGVPVGFRATGNPGGPGQGWVRARYIDPAPLGWNVIRDSRTGLERVYIPSRVADNRYLGNDYVQRLRGSGSDQLVKAWLEGDWTAIEGAFFSEWSNERHVLPPFTIPRDWLRFRSMDWGSAAPFSVGWWAVVGDDHTLEPSSLREGSGGIVLPRGSLVRYREWYGASAPNAGLKLTAEEVASGILTKSLPDRVEGKEPYAYTVVDPSMWKQDGGPSIAERMGVAGVRGMRPADNSRISQKGAMGGWDQMRSRLKGDGARPALYVFGTCVDFIRTIPVLQHDPDRPEDLDTSAEDHVADEARYACMSRPYVPRPPAEAPRPRELTYTAMPDGRIVGSMSIMDIVRERMRKRELDE
jgi:hypothetical protein